MEVLLLDYFENYIVGRGLAGYFALLHFRMVADVVGQWQANRFSPAEVQ